MGQNWRKRLGNLRTIIINDFCKTLSCEDNSINTITLTEKCMDFCNTKMFFFATHPWVKAK